MDLESHLLCALLESISISIVRALAAENLRFSWMYLESHLFCALLEVTHFF